MNMQKMCFDCRYYGNECSGACVNDPACELYVPDKLTIDETVDYLKKLRAAAELECPEDAEQLSAALRLLEDAKARGLNIHITIEDGGSGT